MKNYKKNRIFLLTLCLCWFYFSTNVTVSVAAEPNMPVLLVNGVDAFSTPTGPDYSFDQRTNTIVLDNYNGGAIEAEGMDLNIVVKNSGNTITSADGIGISCSGALSIRGEGQAALTISGKTNAVNSGGNLTLNSISITAQSNGTAGGNETIQCRGQMLEISGCTMKVTTLYAGIACYNNIDINDSDITVDSTGVGGINANNEVLSISNTKLNINVTGPGGSALMSQLGNIKLDHCTGNLNASLVTIYNNNTVKSKDADIKISGCDFALAAPYGILGYCDIMVTDGKLDLAGITTTGIWTHSVDTNAYSSDLSIQGNVVILGGNCKQALLSLGTTEVAGTADITGLGYSNGNKNVSIYGQYTLSDSSLFDNKNLTIEKNAVVTIPAGSSIDLSKASVVNKGEIINNGSLQVGKIEFFCNLTWNIPGVTPVYIHDWNEGRVVKEATTLADGELLYTCKRDSSHTKKERLAKLQMADYSRLDQILARIPADLSKYTQESQDVLLKAKKSIIRNLDISRQAEVDSYADTLEAALNGLIEYSHTSKTGNEASTDNPQTGDTSPEAVCLYLLSGSVILFIYVCEITKRNRKQWS